MVPQIEAVSANTVDEFFVAFIQETIKQFTGSITPEGDHVAQWMRESKMFREYIIGQRGVLKEGLDAQRVLTATFCVGYRLALFADKIKSPERHDAGKSKPA